jgi:2,4-dienoyl-CoA reductase (NADPH2)
VSDTIDDFTKCAVFAKQAGYDGVEIMGSEGYLINQFTAPHTNHRTDEWGGSYTNRVRFPVEIVKKTRQAVGKDFIIIYRLSMLDLVQNGSTWEEVVGLAKEIENAGATIINTGIGWHEARVPTIGPMVPRGAYAWVTKKMRGEVNIPLCTTNRVNMPEIAEEIISDGYADMVSMARPFLADPEFVNKAAEGRSDEINTCIGCNQACLDHVFLNKQVSCLVNPRACYETNLFIEPVAVDKRQNYAVVGAGPAGLSFATTAAKRGHTVTLFDKASEIGGQFNLAKQVPGKEEFYEAIRYFGKQLELTGVDVRLNSEATYESLTSGGGYDAVVLATGVTPRDVKIPNNSTAEGKVQVVSYVDVLKKNVKVGKRVAVIGAGGIGFDVSDYLTHHPAEGADMHSTQTKMPDGKIDQALVKSFMGEWGVDMDIENRSGLLPEKAVHSSPRHIYLLQRGEGKMGDGLGKTTGWIHRTNLKNRAVEMISGCSYTEVNDQGLLINMKDKKGKGGGPKQLEVDTVIICAGQERLYSLQAELEKAEKAPRVFLIGGSLEATELDAKRAIDQGTRLGTVIETAKNGEVFEAPVGWAYHALKMLRKVRG